MTGNGHWIAGDGPYEIEAEDTCAVWFRKIRYRACAPRVDPKVHAYVCREANSALRAFLESCPSDAKWMSPIQCVDRAELKPVQLECARRVGMRVPRTLIGFQTGRIAGISRQVFEAM